MLPRSDELHSASFTSPSDGNVESTFCRLPWLATDGVFGGGTQTALKQVQAAVGVTADGVYGPNTRNAMKWIHAEI
ncbi:peptidoglycan-binding domain-containing protein [Micromonospora sp. NBC_00389]|uniref:peptidoglycan-binding domain-containing protein n=1 Tax=Micromonospora sp. NBC_00389 TaxID=2903586 RepID=UPI003FA610DD